MGIKGTRWGGQRRGGRKGGRERTGRLDWRAFEGRCGNLVQRKFHEIYEEDHIEDS